MNEEVVKKTIFQLLKRIAPETEPSKLKPDENIRETLNIDSFDALQFIVALDEKLGIEIPEEDYGKTATLKTLLSYLERKINQ
ncbi:acyl carrier protein [Flavobacterium sp. W22_SRS_FP1]|uniref:acyl carrier protein n=1 Tax=Flavobacterium sp. W22_SRS_FP1 TaxID=3240276 RepID=UPI003F933ADD